MSKNPLVVGSDGRPTDRSERLDDMNQPPRLRPNRDRHDWERILALNEAFGSSSLTEANKTWSTTCVFSASDYNTVAWTSGVIDFADGSQYSIGAGNTGNMTGGTVYWIYFDSTVSATALQFTSTASDLASDTALVLCTAKAANRVDSRAFFVPIFGALQVSDINIAVNSISTNMIQANAVTADEISVNNLEAVSVDCGTLTGGILQNASGKRFINLDATSSQSFILVQNDASETKLNVQANGSVTMAGTLVAASGTFGTITAGLLQNAAGTRYIDLSATTTDPFIKHDNFTLLANGTATFSGDLQADSIALKDSGGTTRGTLAPVAGSITLSSSTTALNLKQASGSTVISIGNDTLGFYNGTRTTKPTITGSRGGNAALQSLLNQLSSFGLITNSTS